MQKLSLRFFFSSFLAAFLSGLIVLLLSRFTEGLLPLLLSLLLLSLFLSGVFTRFITGDTGKRLARVAASIGRMGQGDFSQGRPLNSGGEVGKIEALLGEASAALKSRIEGLEDEKGQREAVLASMGEGVIVTDTDGMITLSNKQAAQLFGASLTGRSLPEVSREPKLLDLVSGIRDRWESTALEMTLHKGKALLVTVSPLIRKLKITGSVIVFHDITALKKLETMRKDFVANVSHELKTPLTSIKGFAETLVDGGLDDRENAGRFVETIRRNAERLSRLVDDLLTLSNIELGKVRFDIRSVDLLEVGEGVFSTLGQRADEKGIQLILDIPAGLKVKADRDRLEQVLMNLVDNGIKFTEKGSVSVAAGKAGEGVEISVADTGCGVPASARERLGERFYRVDPARSRALGGTGLGLAIVKHLVSSMWGTFTVESKEGEGTTVSFTLPSP